jgi:hypothetical protein
MFRHQSHGPLQGTTRVLVQLDSLTDRRLDDLGMPALVGLAGSGFYGSTPDVPDLERSMVLPMDGHKADYVLADVNSATVTFDRKIGVRIGRVHDVARTEHYTLDRNNVLPTGVYVPGGGAPLTANLSRVWVDRSGATYSASDQNDLFNQLESVWTIDAWRRHPEDPDRFGGGPANRRRPIPSNLREASVALVDPVLTDRPSDEAPSSHTWSAVSSDTAGLYLQDQIAFSAQLKALLGVRP